MPAQDSCSRCAMIESILPMISTYIGMEMCQLGGPGEGFLLMSEDDVRCTSFVGKE